VTEAALDCVAQQGGIGVITEHDIRTAGRRSRQVKRSESDDCHRSHTTDAQCRGAPGNGALSHQRRPVVDEDGTVGIIPTVTCGFETRFEISVSEGDDAATAVTVPVVPRSIRAKDSSAKASHRKKLLVVAATSASRD